MMIPVAFFGLIAGVLGKQILNRSSRYRVPPDTSVSSSFTFTRDRKKMFEPSRRRFQFRNELFAEAFTEVNRDKLWDPRSALAGNAATKRALVYAFAIAAGAVFVLWSIWNDWYGGS